MNGPFWPWVFAATFIPFGLLLVAWASGLVSRARRVEGATRVWMILLGRFGTCLPVRMLRSFPRVRLVVDRDRRTIRLDQWAMGRHAHAEWPLASIAEIEIVKGVNLNMAGPLKTGFRLQFVLGDGRAIVPTPDWAARPKTIQPLPRR